MKFKLKHRQSLLIGDTRVVVAGPRDTPVELVVIETEGRHIKADREPFPEENDDTESI